MAKQTAKKTTAKKTTAKKEEEIEVSNKFLEKVQAAKEADKAVRAEDGSNVTFVSLAQSLSKALDEDEPEHYIEGLKVKEFYIGSKKLRLGKSLEVVPLSFVTVYNEFSSGQDSKFLGVWHKEDALKYPLCPTHYFNRQLPNGNELRPVKWVLVYLPDYPDIPNVVITFKSTANRIAKSWAKDIESHGGNSSALVYTLNVEKVENAKGKWYQIRPEFSEKVYDAETGKVFKPYAEKVVDLSLEYNESYAKGTLVSRKPEAVTNALEDRSGGFVEYDEEYEDSNNNSLSEEIPFQDCLTLGGL